jgi:hypothetical protein
MAPATKIELEAKMQEVGSELQRIEIELQKCVEVRQRLDSQLNENDQVKKVSILECLHLVTLVADFHPLPGVRCTETRECRIQDGRTCPAQARSARGKDKRRQEVRIYSR